MRSGFTPVFTGDSSATTCKTQCIQMLSERRSTKIHRHKARAWAVATPLCAASEPPNAFGAGGRYRPSWPAKSVAPSRADVQTDLPTNLNRTCPLGVWLSRRLSITERCSRCPDEAHIRTAGIPMRTPGTICTTTV